MKIVLIGFMGAGKTTFGSKVAFFFEQKFIDLDEVFYKNYKISINKFFDLRGEAEFRKIEQTLLLNILNSDKFVLAVGGGTPCFYDNISLINNNAISVYLKCTDEILISRLILDNKNRPLLKNMTNEQIASFVKSKLKEREIYYNKAKIIINEAQQEPYLLFDMLKKQNLV